MIGFILFVVLKRAFVYYHSLFAKKYATANRFFFQFETFDSIRKNILSERKLVVIFSSMNKHHLRDFGKRQCTPVFTVISNALY